MLGLTLYNRDIKNIYWHIEEVEARPDQDKKYHGVWKLKFNYQDNTITGDRCDTQDPSNPFIDHMTGKIDPTGKTLDVEFIWSRNGRPYRFKGVLHTVKSKEHITGDWHSTDQGEEHSGTFDSTPTTSKECSLLQ